MKIKIISILILIFSIVVPVTSHAIGLSNYFGGRVLLNIYCNCSGGKMLVAIQDYSSNRVLRLTYNMSQLTQLFYLNYAPYIGRYVLGSYTPGGDSCRVGIEPFCFPLPVDGRFNSGPGTGTS